MTATVDIFDDLAAEQDRIETILAALDDEAWTSPSAAAGWSIADVVLHLAQTEEAVVASVAGISLAQALPASAAGTSTIDQIMDQWVGAERVSPAATFDRWRRARRAALSALRAADPTTALPWAAAPLRPRTLATTRLAEHWAHALDIVVAVGLDLPDTDRLRHIAWLGHHSLPYGFALVGEQPHDVHCELTAPDEVTMWTYGDPNAPSHITGPAEAFCRVGAHRLAPESSGLVASGPHGPAALRALRNYAG